LRIRISAAPRAARSGALGATGSDQLQNHFALVIRVTVAPDCASYREQLAISVILENVPEPQPAPKAVPVPLAGAVFFVRQVNGGGTGRIRPTRRFKSRPL